MMHIIIDVICSEHTNNLEDSHVDEMEITSRFWGFKIRTKKEFSQLD
jgi:hypothetical protein